MNRQSPLFPSHSPKSRYHMPHLRHPRPSHPHRSPLQSRSSLPLPIDPWRKGHCRSQLFRISSPTPRSSRVWAYLHRRLSLSLYLSPHPNLMLSPQARRLKPPLLCRGLQHQMLRMRLTPLLPCLAQLTHHPLRQRQIQNLKSPLHLIFRLGRHPYLDLPRKLNQCRLRPHSQAHFRLASPLLRHRSLRRRKTLAQLRRSHFSVEQ